MEAKSIPLMLNSMKATTNTQSGTLQEIFKQSFLAFNMRLRIFFFKKNSDNIKDNMLHVS